MTDFEKAKSLLDGLGNGYRVMDEEFIADLKAKYEWPDLGVRNSLVCTEQSTERGFLLLL